ncbi:MAG: TlpA disulfide reductase family protein, partial [Anaerolineales bacterium]
MAETTHLPATEAEASATRHTARRHWGRWLTLAVLLALLGLVGWKLWQTNLGPASSGAAPDFALTTFDGETLRLSDLRGQVVVINIWASWCVPCRDEAPVLERVWREYRDRDVVFLGVDYADTEREARAFIAEFGLTYPNGPDVGT